MKELTIEQLREYEGKTLKVITLNGALLRNNKSAVYVASSHEGAAAFCNQIADQIPVENKQFSAVDFEVPDISFFSLLFDDNYPGFTIVDADAFVPAHYLYANRPEAIKKVTDVYDYGNCLYVAYDADGKMHRDPVGSTHVTISFYTKREDAERVAEAGIGEYKLPRWIANPPYDTTVFSIDGEVVYGYEMYEGTHKSMLIYQSNYDNLVKLVGDEKLQVLSGDENGEQLITYQGLPLFVVGGRDAVGQVISEFDEEDMPEDVVAFNINNSDGVKCVLNNKEYAALQTPDGKYYFRSEDFIVFMSGR